MKQLTKEQAIAFGENRLYEGMDARTIAGFQLQQDRLCVPFNVFWKALEESLGRRVWIHEFAFMDNLREEFNKEKAAPTLQDIINLIPSEKRCLITIE